MNRIWIKKEKEAQDTPRLLAKSMRQRMPADINEKIMNRQFTIEPNTADDRGGFFVIFPLSVPKRWWELW
jgi:hypothetical protein